MDPQGSLDFSPLSAGITVGSFGCGDIYASCAPNQVPGLAGCAKPPPVIPMGGEPQHGKYLVSLVPASCAALHSPEWTPAGTDGRDPLHVLLHELGHALGLDHSDLAGAECQGVEDGDGQPNPGVMWSTVPAFPSGRWLLRDDIEALGSFWGTSDPSSLWRWDEALSFPGSPNDCELMPLGGTSGVPASVSSAVDGFEADAVFLALTDEHDRVRVLEGSAAGFPDVSAAVGGSSGIAGDTEDMGDTGGSGGGGGEDTGEEGCHCRVRARPAAALPLTLVLLGAWRRRGPWRSGGREDRGGERASHRGWTPDQGCVGRVWLRG